MAAGIPGTLIIFIKSFIEVHEGLIGWRRATFHNDIHNHNLDSH